MKAEVIDIPSSSSFIIPVTDKDVTALKNQQKLLKKFINSQMKRANFSNQFALDHGDGDYGTIPGTKKDTLLKPGAEKLLKLFGFGVRVKLVEKIIEKEANLAIFIYEAEVYHLRTGVQIAQCQGVANSQETKYRERTVWNKKTLPNGSEIKESRKEETPIFDILNTLMKMAQKRAIVGATIIATGASDYFTQDLEDAQPTERPENIEASPPQIEEKAQHVCCGKPMMISKYADRETGEFPYYCLKCKKKVSSGITRKGDA